jgi:hypothetical protein
MALDKRYSFRPIISELGKNFICDGCKELKNSYSPWKKNGKKYCSIDCQDKDSEFICDFCKKSTNKKDCDLYESGGKKYCSIDHQLKGEGRRKDKGNEKAFGVLFIFVGLVILIVYFVRKKKGQK